MLKTARKIEAKRRDWAKARKRRGASGISCDGSVLDLMGRISPWLTRPEWFREYAEKVIAPDWRGVFSAPPQHGKTQVTLHALVWLILRYPDKQHAYITYSQERANSVSLELQGLLRAAGVEVSGTLGKIRWGHGKGFVMMVGVDGGITGEKIDGLCVVDDPIKNMQQATSKVERERLLETFRTSVQVRVHKGASVAIMATRWVTEDLSGTCIGTGDWEAMNIPAIAEEGDRLGRQIGEALFPGLWPIDRLNQIQKEIGELSFAAMYQGRPRPRGGAVFHAPTYYRQLPSVFRGAYGIDLAYTGKTTSDWSVCVELLVEHRLDGPMYYVKWIDFKRVDADEFCLVLKQRHEHRKSWPMVWRLSGQERGVLKFIRKLGIPLQGKTPPGDKYVSAMDIASAWNSGRLLMPDLDEFPECAIWANEAIRVIMGFTGNNQEEDDIVDALGNAHYALSRAGVSKNDRPEFPKLRMAGGGAVGV